MRQLRTADSGGMEIFLVGMPFQPVPTVPTDLKNSCPKNARQMAGYS